MMGRRAVFVGLTAFSVLVPACTSDDAGPSVGGTDPAEASCDPQLERAFTAWAAAGFSGSITISTGERVDCQAGYGTADRESGEPITAQTVFNIGSVSKAFTAAAIFDLVDRGALALDDRAGDLILELTGPAAEVTIEQLLLHTSGLTGSHGRDHEALSRRDAIVAISGLESAFQPGTDYLYSNAGYTLLALIVDEVSGQSFRDEVVSEVLPLPGGRRAGGFWDGEPAAPGPRAVGYLDGGPTDQMGGFAGPHWALDGNGSLAMTASDLATWTRRLFTGQQLSSHATELLMDTTYDHGDDTVELPGWVSVDASMFGRPVVAAAGGGGDVGHDVIVAWVPDTSRVIVVASNTPDVTAEDLVEAIGSALVTGEPAPLPPTTPAGRTDPEQLAALVGTYSLATGGSFEVSVRNDQLVVSASGADAIGALFPTLDGFTADDVERHESAVVALLRGATKEGREEVAALESEIGPIDDVTVDGTIVDDRELRTYVTVRAGGRPVLLWYALDDQGGIAAVEGPTAPPSRAFVASGDEAFVPDEPVAGAGDVSVVVDDGRLTVTGPDGVVVATESA